MDNVTALRGTHPQLHNGEPVPEVIEKLEELLEAARSGHLRAFATVRVMSDRSIITSWDGSCDEHDMACGVAKLFHRYLRDSVLTDE